MQRSRFAQTQTLVIQEARELRSKLIDMRKKKEQQNSQLIKGELSELYNSKFEQFKRKLDEQEEDQLTSLELAKELRLTQIIDVQNRLKDYISKIEQQEKTLKQKSAELNNAYQDALSFLSEQMQHEFDALRRQKEQELAEKVLIYKDSIDIE